MKTTDLRVGGIYLMKNGTRKRIDQAVAKVGAVLKSRPAIVTARVGNGYSFNDYNDVIWTRIDRPGVTERGQRSGRCYSRHFAKNALHEMDAAEAGVLI